MSIEGLKYTGIGDKNRSYFDKMLYDDKPAEAGDVLRVGLIKDGAVAGAASVTFEEETESVLLGSFFIAPTFRREGLGRELLSRMEDEVALYASGIEAEFTSKSVGMAEFFTQMGYAVSEGYPIYSMKVSDFLGNRHMIKFTMKTKSSHDFTPFSGMTSEERYSCYDRLFDEGVFITEDNTDGLLLEYSGIIKGEDGEDICMICRESEDTIILSQLIRFGEGFSTGFTEALLTFCSAIERTEGRYENIAIVMANPKVGGVLPTLLGDKFPHEVTQSYRAVKAL